jgi:protein required for attachment to host cells
MSTTWILLADGNGARLLQYGGAGAQEIDSWQSPEPQPDPERHVSARFAQELADILSNRQSSYDRLVLVAAPPALITLRTALNEQVHAKLVAQVDHDLSHVPAADLPDHLQEFVRI